MTAATSDRPQVPVVPVIITCVVVLLIGLLLGSRLGSHASSTTVKLPAIQSSGSANAAIARGVALMKGSSADGNGAVDAAVGFVTALPDLVLDHDAPTDQAIRDMVYLDGSAQALTQVRGVIDNGKQTVSTLGFYETMPVWYRVSAPTDPSSGTNVDMVVANVIVDRGSKIADAQWSTQHFVMKQQFGSWRVASWQVENGIAGQTTFPVNDATQVETLAINLKGYKRFNRAPTP